MKWQEINEFGKRHSTKSLVFLPIVLALILNLAGMSYSDDGDKICTDCYSLVEVNSTYWEVGVEHAGDKDLAFKKRARSRTLWINLDKVSLVTTDPPIETELLVPTIKKYATVNHPEYGYLRPIKDGDKIIKRKTKARPYPSRIILHGIKPADLTVKWSFDLDYYLIEDINIDPIWESVPLIETADLPQVKACDNFVYNDSPVLTPQGIILRNSYGICLINYTHNLEKRTKAVYLVCDDGIEANECQINEIKGSPDFETTGDNCSISGDVLLCEGLTCESKNDCLELNMKYEKEI